MEDKRIICFVRHGKTTQNLKSLISGRQDFQLSDTGREEALKTALFLKEIDPQWDLICASPLSRAQDTARIIGNTLGYKKEVLTVPAFIERDFGVAEGMPVCPETYVHILDDTWEGMEKTKDLGIRTFGGLKELLNSTDAKKIIIVSHAHAIKGVLKAIDDNRTMSDPIRNCSLNYVEYENGHYIVTKTNIVPE